jgi:hypothetical protein
MPGRRALATPLVGRPDNHLQGRPQSDWRYIGNGMAPSVVMGRHFNSSGGLCRGPGAPRACEDVGNRMAISNGSY